jgi:hypothetical protein
MQEDFDMQESSKTKKKKKKAKKAKKEVKKEEPVQLSIPQSQIDFSDVIPPDMPPALFELFFDRKPVMENHGNFVKMAELPERVIPSTPTAQKSSHSAPIEKREKTEITSIIEPEEKKQFISLRQVLMQPDPLDQILIQKSQIQTQSSTPMEIYKYSSVLPSLSIYQNSMQQPVGMMMELDPTTNFPPTEIMGNPEVPSMLPSQMFQQTIREQLYPSG